MNSLSKLQKQIIDFGNSVEFKELDAYYSQPSIFSALGVSRHENTHSNFLAWLLTPKPEKNDHSLGDTPLRKFLETLALACALPHSAGKLSPELSGAITTGAYTLSNIVVEREKHIGVGRLDIYLEGNISFDGSEYPLTLIIENKVKSHEHDAQTGRYLEALRPPVLRPGIFLSVFLTPLPNREYERLGKPIGGDILEGKQTYLMITAMSRASEEDREVLRHTHTDPALGPAEKIARVKAVYDKYDIPRLTEQQISLRFERALAQLDTLTAEPGRTATLRRYAESLMGRKH